MRIIKFRVWDKINKKMTCSRYGWFLHPETYSIDFGINIGDDITPERKIEEFEIMQYTDLKDSNKNGKEIYEGDIIDVKWNGFGIGANFKSTVVWENIDTAFGVWTTKGGWHSLGDLDYNEALFIEVIGNIYENPELLEQE